VALHVGTRGPNHRHGPDRLKVADQCLRLRLLQALTGAKILGGYRLGHRGQRHAVLGRKRGSETRFARRARIRRTHHEHIEQVTRHGD
jgi:hypothetical protein